MILHSWTVSDAKAQLSRILRLAQTEGPQRIGLKHPCVVVPEAEWNKLTETYERPHLGRWLTEHFTGIGELDLPDRQAIDTRSIPFVEDEKR